MSTRGRLLATLLAAAALVVSAAGQARAAAATEVSSNWSGYVASGSQSFTSVSASWVVSKATCTTGSSSSAAAWVGLGGNSETSDALEQVGSEVDCSPAGTASYSLWYELVPAAAVPIKLAVEPGDSISASVSVRGTRVTLRIENVTRGTSFTKTLTMAAPDLSSAEWVVEAPSVCSNYGGCRTLALANFGKTVFSKASATAAGHTGGISDAAWSATAIELVARSGLGAAGPGGPGFGGPAFGGPGATSSAGAVPGALSSSGRSFAVAWVSGG
jgi:hypothetical protein